MRELNRSFLPLLMTLLSSCSSQTVAATRSEPDAGTLVDAEADASYEGLTEADSDVPGIIFDASKNRDATLGCPGWGCIASDDHFPAEPLLRAEDVEPNLRFGKIGGNWVLAFREAAGGEEPLVVYLGRDDDPEPFEVCTLDTPAGALRAKEIANDGSVLACSDEGCHVYAREGSLSEPLVAMSADPIPLPGEPDVLVMTQIGMGPQSHCVLGDGAACLYDDMWNVVVEPGTGPKLLDVATSSSTLLFVGEGGRMVAIDALGATEAVLEAEQVFEHVVARERGNGDSPQFVVLGSNPATIWTYDGMGWSDCPRDVADELAIVEFLGSLRGVRASGTPFQEMEHNGELYWMDLIPEDEELFHGELTDGDVFICGVWVNYLRLQADAVWGTTKCAVP